jgi:hypothetical protein
MLDSRDQRFCVVEFSVQHRDGFIEKDLDHLKSVVICVESCVERKYFILNPLGVCASPNRGVQIPLPLCYYFYDKENERVPDTAYHCSIR